MARRDLTRLCREVKQLADEVAALADDEDLELTDVQRQFRRAFASPGFPFAELVRLAHEKYEKEVRELPTPPPPDADQVEPATAVEDLTPECPTATASGHQAAPPPAAPPEVAPVAPAQPQGPPREPAQPDAAPPRADSGMARLRRGEGFGWGDIFRR